MWRQRCLSNGACEGSRTKEEGTAIRREWKSVEKGVGVTKPVFPTAQSAFMTEQGVEEYKPDETRHAWVTEG